MNLRKMLSLRSVERRTKRLIKDVTGKDGNTLLRDMLRELSESALLELQHWVTKEIEDRVGRVTFKIGDKVEFRGKITGVKWTEPPLPVVVAHESVPDTAASPWTPTDTSTQADTTAIKGVYQ